MQTKLPLECDVRYYESFIEEEQANCLFDFISKRMNTDNHQMQLENGELFEMNIGRCFFLEEHLWDLPCFMKVHGEKIPWPKPLLYYKEKIEKITGKKFDVGSVSFYKDGTREVKYHVDYPYFGNVDYIPSLSLGATRTFGLREIKNPSNELQFELKNGDVLIMGPDCQYTYEHAVLINSEVTKPRVNITFWQLNNYI